LEERIKTNKIIPVILSGGSGTRLWPLSRSSLPKQYLNLDSRSENSLLQNTFLRLRGIKNISDPIIICNEEQRFIVAEQFRSISVIPSTILLEPFGRNTAPAIALAALNCIKKDFDPILLVLSSDHKIKNKINFHQSIHEGIIFAQKGNLVTLGVKPNSPNTGFGYIESIDEISNTLTHSKINKFIEKPNLEKAKFFLKDSHFTWNSGIFLFRASSILNELNKYQPDLIDNCKKSLSLSSKDFEFQRVEKDIFVNCPNISIDKAVMEKTELGQVIFLDAGWSDLGCWQTVWEDSKKDKNQNTVIGKSFVKNVKNSYIRSESRLVVGLGLKDIVLIETDDAVFVSKKNSINNIKDLVKELQNKDFEEIYKNRKVHRPWGNFFSVVNGDTWQVKKLEINPKASLSLQMHHHRSEHWIVVKNTAKVEIDGKTSFLEKNESIYVPKGIKHRLSNPGSDLLILIEVQSGNYLGEDDIIRFDDKYKRN
tara:strand:- start:2411 stop:3856 length:1446 start_codon:yes stop_codon:yes gene_type:complete